MTGVGIPAPDGTLNGLAPLLARIRERMPPPARFDLYLTRPAGAATIACDELLEPATLRRFFVGALSDLTDTPAEEDQRIAAQRFFKKYSAAVLPASLLTLAGGVAIDVSIPRLSFVVENEMFRGVLIESLNARTTPERRAAWPVDAPATATLDELRAHTLESLFEGNLAPAIEAVLRAVRVSRRLLWCNVSEQIDLLYAGAQAARGIDAAALEADRDVVLNRATLPGSARPNPVYGTFEWESDPRFDKLFMLRDVCCMQFRLPARSGRYCGNCGLPTAEERSAMRLRSSREGADPRTSEQRGPRS
jgi:ferric iron reductase protein FhuF